MSKVIASITTSVDGYIVGPEDGPGCGLGVGGERLHYWVMGGPWTYADNGRDAGGMQGSDKEFFDNLTEGMGCGIVGRNMYEAAGAWGGSNPFPGTLIVLTHRTGDQPDPSTGFLFVDGFDAAMAKARELAGDGAVALGGAGRAGRRQAAVRGVRAGPRPRRAGRVELEVRHPRAVRRTPNRDAVTTAARARTRRTGP
jgi:dihydrofolate reductase